MWVIGFGTLLLKHSLGDTVGGEVSDQKKYVPITVNGYKRLFNVRAEHYTPSHKVSDKDNEMGAANVEFSPMHSFNGVAFEVDDSELELLDTRERYYERIEVDANYFDSGLPLGEACVYCAMPDSKWVEDDNEKLLPHWRDIDYARRGAYAIGDDFGRAYDESTYMADGKTLMVDFYQNFID